MCYLCDRSLQRPAAGRDARPTSLRENRWDFAAALQLRPRYTKVYRPVPARDSIVRSTHLMNEMRVGTPFSFERNTEPRVPSGGEGLGDAVCRLFADRTQPVAGALLAMR